MPGRPEGSTSPVGGGLSNHLKQLAEARDAGLISEAEFSVAKARLLGSSSPQRTAPGSGPSSAETLPMILGFALATAATARFINYFLSGYSYSFISFNSYWWNISLVPLFIIVGISSLAGITTIQNNRISWPVYAAIPVLIASSLDGLDALSDGFYLWGISAFACSAAVITSAVLFCIMVGSERLRDTAVDPILILLGAIAAISILIFFFVEGWSTSGSLSLYGYGKVWISGASGYDAIRCVLMLSFAVGIPILAAISADRIASLWFAIGSFLQLLATYFFWMWEGFIGELEMNGTIAFLFIALLSLLGMICYQLVKAQDEGTNALSTMTSTA